MKWNRLLVIPLFITVVGVWFLWPTQKAEAGWYDEMYSYREKITFTHNATVSTDSRVTLTIDTATPIAAGKMQNDCDDVRFTDINGKSLRFQLTGTCNNASTTFDVVFPSIINGTNANVAYMYYGNPSASSASENVSSVPSLTPSGSPSFGSEENGPTPIAYWKFDEGTGTSANDATQNGNTGTLTNGPAWKNSDECVSGKCLYFDGSNDYVSVNESSSLDFGTNDFTVSSWIKGTNTATDKRVIYKYNANTTRGFMLGTNSSGYGLFQLWSTGTVVQASVIGTTLLNDNQWHYITGIRSGTTNYLYVDGNLEGSTAGASSNVTGSANLYIGSALGSGNFFPGYIDEPKIYNYARSSSQIQTDYLQSASSKGSGVSFGVNRNKSGLNLTNGLVGYWKMEENTGTTTTDSSGNSNTGTLTNGPTWTSGKFGISTTYDGTNDYVSVADSNSLDFGTNQDFSYSFWMEPVSSVTSKFVMSKGATGTADTGYSFVMQSGVTPLAELSKPGEASRLVITGSNITDTNWHHIVVTYSRNGNGYIYQDGVLTGSTDVSGYNVDLSNSNNLALGCTYTGATCWNGSLDDFRIYNRALSPAEVQALYNFAPGPVGYWKLDDNTGTTSVDSSGTGNNGTLTNGPTWTTGKSGSAVNFDGSNDYIDAGNSNSLEMGIKNWTMEAWFKTTDTTSRMRIITRQSTGYYFLGLGNSNTLYNGIYDGTNNNISESVSAAAYRDGNWHHYAISIDRNSTTGYKVYMDGILVDTRDPTAVGNVAPVASTYIGMYAPSTQPFNGSIDDVRIYNYARTSGQIIEDMNAGRPNGNNESSVLYWKFNEGSGTTAHDLSGNGFDGTINGPTWTTSGKFGTALTFDGSNDLVSKTDNDALDLGTGTYTATAWINTTATASGSDPIITKGGSTSGSKGYWFATTTSGNLYVLLSDGSSYIINGVNSNKIVADGTWHQVGFTWDPTIGMKLYVDGKLDKVISVTTTVDINSANAFSVGYSTSGFSPQGTIDEVKIYKTALTDSQMLVDYNQNQASVMGAKSTASDGVTPDNSSAREYCVPGDTSTCSAPVGEWLLDENTGTSAKDTSGNGNNGTITNSPSWSVGKYGSAISFNNGSSQYIDTGNPSVLQLSAMSISFWAYSTANTNSIISKGAARGNNANRDWDIFGDGTNLKFFASDGVNPLFTATATYPSLNVWHFITATWTGSTATGGVNLYIDGKLANSTTATGTGITNLRNLFIGGGTGSGFTFSGIIDQVRVYNYARSPAQVAWDYNRGGPVGWWRFDECQGTTMYDSAPNLNDSITGNNGTLTIGPLSTQTSAGTCGSGTSTEAWNNGTNGKIKSSISFDGSDDKITTGSGPYNNFGTSAFSVAAWIKTTESDNQNCIASIAGSSTGWRFGFGGNGKPYFLYGDGPHFVETTIGTQTLNDGTWHHLTEVYDSGNQVSAYIDGNYVGSASISSVTGSASNGTTLYIGTMSGTSGLFNGQIDDLRIYNYTLTPTQIKNIVNDGSSVRFAPLTGSP